MTGQAVENACFAQRAWNPILKAKHLAACNKTNNKIKICRKKAKKH
jgi:hypothetical protein